MEPKEGNVLSTKTVIDWKSKLSSRKLWAALAAVAVTILTAMFKDELGLDETTIDMIQSGVGALCVYIFGEAGVDIAREVFKAILTNKSTPDVIVLPAKKQDTETKE